MFLLQLIQYAFIEDLLVNPYFDSLGYIILWLIDVEPLMLFYLFYPKSEVRIRDQYMINQIFHISREEMWQIIISFQYFLI